jgi:hypothetical protein
MFQESIKVSLIAVSVGLKIFKFYEHPGIRAQIAVMKTEFAWYQALADSIKSFEERKDSETKDTFDLTDWSREVKLCNATGIHVRFACSANRLSVSLLSSVQLTMTIRRGLTPTTMNYRYSPSLTNEPCSSRVSR